MSAIMPTYARTDLEFVRGEGVFLYDAEDREYLDFGSGIAVNALGHAHPRLVEAVTQQAQQLWHTSNLYRIPNQEELANRLTENSFADLVFFNNSGGEAVECAVKVARKYHHHHGSNRYRVITFEGAFHGRSLSMISAGKQAKHLEGFGPEVDGFDQVPLGDRDATRAAISEDTAAILIEPIQGEGGIVPAPDGFLKFLRDLCDEHGLLLILDEVQTGVGRTGKFFAYEWSGIEPDIMALAKGLGGGFPIGACLATKEAAAGMVAGAHGSTFGGNPLATAVGSAVVEIVSEPAFLENVELVSNRLVQGLAMLKDKYPDIISEIRGRGLLIGVKCIPPNTDLIAAALEERLLTAIAGDNVVRLLPPLITSQETVVDALDRLDRACASLRDQSQKASAV